MMMMMMGMGMDSKVVLSIYFTKKWGRDWEALKEHCVYRLFEKGELIFFGLGWVLCAFDMRL
jgi:hypothetical protein